MQRASQVLKNILIPSCRWKSGQVNLKIRKASIICMIHLVNNRIISSEELLEVIFNSFDSFYQHFKELLPIVKSCSNDDWGPDLRYMSCKLMKNILLLTKDDIVGKILIKLSYYFQILI